MYCYYAKISVINTVIQKRAKLQFCQQIENFPVLLKNYLLCPSPMSQAIFNLNYLHCFAVLADTIFAHL